MPSTTLPHRPRPEPASVSAMAESMREIDAGFGSTRAHLIALGHPARLVDARGDEAAALAARRSVRAG